MNFAALVVLSTLWATVPYSITPQAISAQIASRGAATVLQELYNDEDVWSTVLEHIGTGQPNWLSAGANLHKASDAGASEDLEVAFFFALNHSATQVLRISSPEEMSQICSSNFLIDNRADKTSLSWVDDRLKSVRAVRDPYVVVGSHVAAPKIKGIDNRVVKIRPSAIFQNGGAVLDMTDWSEFFHAGITLELSGGGRNA